MTAHPRTGFESYRHQLLLHLRLRDLPGPRIAEVLAEVDSHTADTGEDPHAAFGPPQQYAASVVEALGTCARGWRSWLSPRQAAVGAAAAAGGYLLAEGLFVLGAGDRGALGQPPVVCIVVGLALFLGVWLALGPRRTDRVLDPRTGADMTPRSPRRVSVAVVALPAGMLLLAYAGGVLLR